MGAVVDVGVDVGIGVGGWAVLAWGVLVGVVLGVVRGVVLGGLVLSGLVLGAAVVQPKMTKTSESAEGGSSLMMTPAPAKPPYKVTTPRPRSQCRTDARPASGC